MNPNYTMATAAQLGRQSDVDKYISDACSQLKKYGTVTNAEYREFAEYMLSDNPTSRLFMGGGTSTRGLINRVFTNVLDNISLPVSFRQLDDPYYFQVSGPTFSSNLPLVATRAVFCYLKLYGVKCAIYKRDRNVCSPLVTCLSELAFLGKSSVSIPGIKPIAEACGKLKGRMSPWYPASEPIPDPSDSHPDEASVRFSGAPWFRRSQRTVTLIGCGGLGSNIAVSLCRVLGEAGMILYDGDIVEHRNLAGQNFGVSDIGLTKVSCVKSQCLNLNPRLLQTITAVDRNFSRGDRISDVVVTGLDNMASRNLVFYEWQNNITEDNINATLLIDARLSAEKWQIFCIRGNDKKAQDEYSSKWLFPDSEATSDVCSYKQTAFAAQMCASFVTNLFVNFCSNLDKIDTNPLYRFLPFMTEYDASQMHLKFTEL